MFRNSSFKQFKAYLRRIENFDELYIIQQAREKINLDDVISALEGAIARDAESVFDANKSLWNSLNISKSTELKKLAESKQLSSSPSFEAFRNIIKITIIE